MRENQRPKWTVEEYLFLEKERQFKHEYIDGDIFVMMGCGASHSRITINTMVGIYGGFNNDNYTLLSGDMRVKISPTRYVYPDFSAVLGEPQTEDEDYTLLNPAFVLEVTSDATFDYDHSAKPTYYSQSPCIKTCLIIDKHRIYAELYERSDVGWRLQVFTSVDDVITLDSLNIELPLARIYRGLSLAGQPD